MSFPLKGIMQTPSELDAMLTVRRCALEVRLAEAVMQLELARAGVESADGIPTPRRRPSHRT